MKKIQLLFPILFAAGLLHADPPKIMPIQTFGGLNTDDSELSLAGGSGGRDESPDSENVVTDLGPGISGRTGFVRFSTNTGTSDFWSLPHSNGTLYSIIATTAGYIKADTGSGTYAIQVSTIATGIRTVGAVLGDYFYFSNATDGLKRATFSGSSPSVSLVDATLKATIMASWRGRIWLGGISGAERSVRASEYLVGTNYTLPTSVDPPETDPVLLTVQGGLDEGISALYPYQDKLVWMKNHSFGAFYGSRRSNFQAKVFSEKVGTAYPDSIQDCDGVLRWLGPSRTAWGWNGGVFSDENLISRHNNALFASVVQGDASSRSNTITTQSDFDSGTNYQTSNSISPNDVVLSTWTDTDTTTADFAAGTTSNTSVINNRVYLSTSDTNVLNNGFESVFTSADWTASGASSRTSCKAYSGSYSLFLSSGTSFVISVYNTSSVLLSSSSLNAGGLPDIWGNRTFDLSSYAGKYIKVRLSLGSDYVDSAYFLCSGGIFSFYSQVTSDCTGSPIVLIDSFSNGRSDIYSGTLTSASFDTAFSSAAWISSGANWTTNGHAVSFQTQTSSDSVNWNSLVSWSTGTAPTSAFARYIRYVVTMSTGGTTNGTALPYVDDVTFSARATTGSYVSQSISLGTSISSFGLFNADTDLNDGSVTYAIYTDSDTTKTVTNGVPVEGTYISSRAITSDSIPSVSTAAYAFIGESFTITAATQTPTNHSLSLSWVNGSPIRVASAYTNQRYWLGVAVNSTSNNRVLVYDRNGEWQRYSGISADSMGIYNSNLYFGNSSGIFQAESGTTDNGTAISAYYRTPAYFPSESLDLISTFRDLRVTTEQSDETLQTAFRIDGNSTEYSMGDMAMNATTGFQNFKLPFSSSEIMRGKYIGFKFSVDATTAWRILGASLYHSPDLEPQ